MPAAFGRLCVETPQTGRARRYQRQPPSGGCVLKHACQHQPKNLSEPAAFGRLCVETLITGLPGMGKTPAAFGRLCVETEWW